MTAALRPILGVTSSLLLLHIIYASDVYDFRLIEPLAHLLGANQDVSQTTDVIDILVDPVVFYETNTDSLLIESEVDYLVRKVGIDSVLLSKRLDMAIDLHNTVIACQEKMHNDACAAQHSITSLCQSCVEQLDVRMPSHLEVLDTNGGVYDINDAILGIESGLAALECMLDKAVTIFVQHSVQDTKKRLDQADNVITRLQEQLCDQSQDFAQECSSLKDEINHQAELAAQHIQTNKSNAYKQIDDALRAVEDDRGAAITDETALKHARAIATVNSHNQSAIVVLEQAIHESEKVVQKKANALLQHCSDAQKKMLQFDTFYNAERDAHALFHEQVESCMSEFICQIPLFCQGWSKSCDTSQEHLQAESEHIIKRWCDTLSKIPWKQCDCRMVAEWVEKSAAIFDNFLSGMASNLKIHTVESKNELNRQLGPMLVLLSEVIRTGYAQLGIDLTERQEQLGANTQQLADSIANDTAAWADSFSENVVSNHNAFVMALEDSMSDIKQTIQDTFLSLQSLVSCTLKACSQELSGTQSAQDASAQMAIQKQLCQISVFGNVLCEKIFNLQNNILFAFNENLKLAYRNEAAIVNQLIASTDQINLLIAAMVSAVQSDLGGVSGFIEQAIKNSEKTTTILDVIVILSML